MKKQAKIKTLLDEFTDPAMEARRIRPKPPNDPVRTISGVRIYDPRPCSLREMDDDERHFRNKIARRRAQNKAGRKSRIKNRKK